MNGIILESLLACPHCGFARQEIMLWMPASSITNAATAKYCYDQIQETVACSVCSGLRSVLRFNGCCEDNGRA